MLNYFGEKDAPECGVCDVCRAKRYTEPDEADIAAMSYEIIKRLQTYGTVTVDSLIASFPTRRALAAEVLRLLVDDGAVEIKGRNVALIDSKQLDTN